MLIFRRKSNLGAKILLFFEIYKKNRKKHFFVLSAAYLVQNLLLLISGVTPEYQRSRSGVCFVALKYKSAQISH